MGLLGIIIITCVMSGLIAVGGAGILYCLVNLFIR